MKHSGVETIDYAFVSHFDKDHAQGIAAAARLMNVKNLVLPHRRENEAIEYKDIIEKTAKEKGINVLYFMEGDSLTIDGVRFEAFAPTPEECRKQSV